MNDELYVEILTPLPLTSREEGDKVLRLWETLLPAYLPDKYGNWEPIHRPFNLQNREAILSAWDWPFLAKKSKPKVDASVFMRKGGSLGPATWDLQFRFAEVDVNALSHFLAIASNELEADFGCLTLFTQGEIEASRQNGTAMKLDREATHFSFGLSTRILRNCIPDVYWTTLLGSPYVQMFGKNKLLSAPVFRAEAVNDTTVVLQLTPRLEDVRSDPPAFAEIKKRVKSFLGEEAFFTVKRQSNCKRPEFTWK